MSVYELNHNKLIAEMMPIVLRKSKHLAWLTVLLWPLAILHGRFNEFRREILVKIETTPQVWAIQKILNDQYDYVQRRIYIKDGLYSAEIRFNEPTTNSPVRFYETTPVHSYTGTLEELKAVDFEVVVPKGVLLTTNDKVRFEGLIKEYALLDKTFKIKEK